MSARTGQQVLSEAQGLLANRKFTGDTAGVRRRQRTEETIVLAVVIVLIDAGYYLGVNDGEEITIHHSQDIAAIQKVLFATDEDYLYVYKLGGGSCDYSDTRPDSWVRCVYGNDGYDVISDYLTDLESVIGEGTAVAEIIAKAEEGHV